MYEGCLETACLLVHFVLYIPPFEGISIVHSNAAYAMSQDEKIRYLNCTEKEQEAVPTN